MLRTHTHTHTCTLVNQFSFVDDIFTYHALHLHRVTVCLRLRAGAPRTLPCAVAGALNGDIIMPSSFARTAGRAVVATRRRTHTTAHAYARATNLGRVRCARYCGARGSRHTHCHAHAHAHTCTRTLGGSRHACALPRTLHRARHCAARRAPSLAHITTPQHARAREEERERREDHPHPHPPSVMGLTILCLICGGCQYFRQ